jgi:hypothetical protein
MATLPFDPPAADPPKRARLSLPAAPPLPFSSLGAAGGLGIGAEEILQGAGTGQGFAGGAAPTHGRAAVEIPTEQMSPARVVELMRAGGEDTRVAQQGATALVALSGGRGLRADRVAALTAFGEDYKARCQNCVDLGAVGCLVAALRTHASVPAVAEEACVALRNIAGIPAGKDACLSEGA